MCNKEFEEILKWSITSLSIIFNFTLLSKQFFIFADHFYQNTVQSAATVLFWRSSPIFSVDHSSVSLGSLGTILSLFSHNPFAFQLRFFRTSLYLFIFFNKSTLLSILMTLFSIHYYLFDELPRYAK